MPPLVVSLRRADARYLRAVAHVHPPVGWFASNSSSIGVAEAETEAILLRVSSSRRQATSIEVELLGEEDGRENVHLEYRARRFDTPISSISLLNSEYDQAAASLVAGVTGPETDWRVQVEFRYGGDVSSAIALPATFVVGKAKEVKGFRLAGHDEGQAFDIVIEQVNEELVHTVVFEELGGLEDSRVAHWLSASRNISRSFLSSRS